MQSRGNRAWSRKSRAGWVHVTSSEGRSARARRLFESGWREDRKLVRRADPHDVDATIVVRTRNELPLRVELADRTIVCSDVAPVRLTRSQIVVWAWFGEATMSKPRKRVQRRATDRDDPVQGKKRGQKDLVRAPMHRGHGPEPRELTESGALPTSRVGLAPTLLILKRPRWDCQGVR
jgi:hypothetical protein